MYIFGRFDEVSAIRKPKIITSSITGSQIFFADFVFFTKTKGNTAYRKTVNNTNILCRHYIMFSVSVGLTLTLQLCFKMEMKGLYVCVIELT